MKKGSSPNDKKIIELLKKNPLGLQRNDIKNNIVGLGESRLTESLQRLVERKIIRKEPRFDVDKGKHTDYFLLTALENVANPSKLKEHIEFYQKSKENKTLTSELQKEMEYICVTSNVRDKPFIQFIVNEANKINEDTHILRRCLGHLANNLYRSIDTHEASVRGIFTYDEQELLGIIQKSLDILQKIVFDKKRTPGERLETLAIIRQFRSNVKYNVAFKLMISDFNIFENEIETLILEYAIINPDDCKKQLWLLLDKEPGGDIEKKIKYLLELIRYKLLRSNKSLPFKFESDSLGMSSFYPSGDVSLFRYWLMSFEKNAYKNDVGNALYPGDFSSKAFQSTNVDLNNLYCKKIKSKKKKEK
jgi:hypothetical protein